MYKRVLILIIFLFFAPIFGSFVSADHLADTPFCGDGIVAEGEKCAYDVGLTQQCWKEGAKIGPGNHYQLGELCLGYDNRTNKSTGDGISLVKITPKVELSFIGKLMSPIIKMQLNKAIDEILSDLKFYVENGTPSPSKLAAQKK
jgi:hypothetical protein